MTCEKFQLEKFIRNLLVSLILNFVPLFGSCVESPQIALYPDLGHPFHSIHTPRSQTVAGPTS